jgi:glycosyltransferase involved in cell wall biosynthesis
LNANKDPLTVLDAVESVAAALPAVTLTMVFNTTELLASVRARIDRSDALRRSVRLLGPIAHHDLPAHFSAADLFVVGSHHEGSGYSLMEALACGAMPVVTDIPTFRVLTGNGEAGPLWTPGDAHSCASAIERAARQPIAREHIVAYFERHFSWNAVGRRALEIYGDVIRRRARSA